MKWFIVVVVFCSVQAKKNLTLDDFFNYTSFREINLSPNGQYLLMHTKTPRWNTDSFENDLWLYELGTSKKMLITNELFEGTKLQWSPSGNQFFFLETNSSRSSLHRRPRTDTKNSIFIYSILTEKITAIPIGVDIPLAISWSANDASLYYATILPDEKRRTEWKDVVEYSSDANCTIRQIFIETDDHSRQLLTKDIVNVPFLIGDLLYAPIQGKLVFTSIISIVSDAHLMQLYSFNVNNTSSILQLTTGESFKQNLRLSSNRERIFFQIFPLTSSESGSVMTQQRIFAINLMNDAIEWWGNDFQGNLISYTPNPYGGIYYLGQLATNIQVYSQVTASQPSTLHNGFNGSYQLIASALLTNASIVIFTCFTKAEEAYFIDDISQLLSAIQITDENKQFDEFLLPQGRIYQWKNSDDNRTIEGTLRYPPGQFGNINLPLFVLIHGGPTEASLNDFLGNWLTWGSMAAAQGWLVLEPNYRGSTGYGDQFLNEIRYHPLTRPGKDILYGIDQLITEGIADPTKLTVGGYSYGGYLTNWLITQDARFKAAVSGAGAVEQTSAWGTTDLPVYADYLFGGFPWAMPNIYVAESAIYQFGNIRTPTHIVSGENDIRVPVSQSIMLERSIRYLGIPVKLLLIPNEGHPMGNNPWHGKIKVREELDWLEQYGLKTKG